MDPEAVSFCSPSLWAPYSSAWPRQQKVIGELPAKDDGLAMSHFLLQQIRKLELPISCLWLCAPWEDSQLR